ncbi:MAG: hypothetical protein M5U09_27780 [Gammaproteobacteria bacterium]|nr:hypothetical protein [Gammaproteobacteria bacterium]
MRGTLVPNKVETSTPEVLRRAIEIARADSLPLAIHAGYNIHEFYHVVNAHHVSPLQYLARLGYRNSGRCSTSGIAISLATTRCWASPAAATSRPSAVMAAASRIVP